jgi:hypothetical protein
MEEAQHAKIDILEMDRMSGEIDAGALERACDEYFGILAAFDELLAQQVDMDLECLPAVIGRPLSRVELAEIRAVQLQSYRTDFLVMGMTNTTFIGTLGKLSPTAATRLSETAKTYGSA